MLSYKNIIRTFEIFAAHDGGLEKDCLRMWAEHDEHGIGYSKLTPFSVEEVREIQSMGGWHLGCDDEYDENDFEKWENKEISDEELMELWNSYTGIYTYE
jgi:hypothetical protein